MNNKNLRIITTALLFALAVACFILFEVVKISLVKDYATNVLLSGVIYYVVIGVLLVWLIIVTKTTDFLRFNKNFSKQLLWALPCFLVAFVNFPYSSLITGGLTISRLDLMGLYIFYIIALAFVEELVFRGILLFLLLDVFRKQKLKYTLTALVSSLVFALFHLTNLFMGMDIGSVLLQVTYTFLIGGMLAVTLMKTQNVWLCIIVHAIFDFGGLLTSHIAFGDPWDTVFWILTIACGILCAGHIIVSLINLERKHVS